MNRKGKEVKKNKYTPEVLAEIRSAAKKNGTTIKEETEKRGLNPKNLSVYAARLKKMKAAGKRKYKKRSKAQPFLDIDLAPQTMPVSQDMVEVIMVPRTSLRSVVEGLW